MQPTPPSRTRQKPETSRKPSDRVTPGFPTPVFDPPHPEQKGLFKAFLVVAIAGLVGLSGWSLFTPSLTNLLLLDVSTSALAHKGALEQICQAQRSTLKSEDQFIAVLFADEAEILRQEPINLLLDLSSTIDCQALTNSERLAELELGTYEGTAPVKALTLAKSYLQSQGNPPAVVILAIHAAEPGQDFADTPDDIAQAVQGLTNAGAVVRIISFDGVLRRALRQQLSVEAVCDPQTADFCASSARRQARAWWRRLSWP